jgi:hypothetical protein
MGTGMGLTIAIMVNVTMDVYGEIQNAYANYRFSGNVGGGG